MEAGGAQTDLAESVVSDDTLSPARLRFSLTRYGMGGQGEEAGGATSGDGRAESAEGGAGGWRGGRARVEQCGAHRAIVG
eukprot:1180145-Prorocentrum_minimum.AAC.1